MKEESLATRAAYKVTNDTAKAAIEEPASRRWKHGEERRDGERRDSPIDRSQPGPKRQMAPGNPEAECGKRQDQKRSSQSQSFA